MNKTKIIYWISTGLMIALFMMSALMYLFNYPKAEGFFINLGFPTWLIYPLAILKIIGNIVILTKFSIFLKELAYAGFLFDAILALLAHLIVADGEHIPALIGIILISFSWFFDRKVFGSYSQNNTNG